MNRSGLRAPLGLVPWLFAIAAVLAGFIWQQGDVVVGMRAPLSSGTAKVGGPFRLVDQSGHARSDADFRGRYMLVYFGYSRCPDVCPTTLSVMADALSRLGPRRKEIVPVFITLDPERDNPQVLGQYLAAFGKDFVGLTGSEERIKAVAAAYHVFYAKHPLAGGDYSVDHTGALYLMGPDGTFVTYYEDESLGPDTLAADLEKRL